MLQRPPPWRGQHSVGWYWPGDSDLKTAQRPRPKGSEEGRCLEGEARQRGFKSRYIPRALAAWRIFAAFVLGACCFNFIVFPDLAKTLTIALYGGPIFIFELSAGFWLVFKDLRPRT
jgi:hypothetical protein